MNTPLRLIGLTTIAAILAACGGAAAPAPTAAPAASTEKQPAQSAAASGACTVSFGAAVSFTGSTAAEGKYTKDGYDIAKDKINEKGGIKVGDKMCKLDIKYYDDASSPDQTAQLVEKLITEDKVNFILGPYGSSSSDTAAAIVEKYKIPMIEANGAAESIFARGFKFTFAVLSPAGNYLRGILDLVKAKDPSAKKVAVVAETDKFALEVAAGAAKYAKEQGFEVVYNDKYPAKATDISSNLTVIKGLNPDVILGAGHIQDAILTIKQGKELGVNAKAWGFSVGPTAPEFRKSLGKDADYVLGAAQWTEELKLKGDANDPFSTPQDFAKAVRAKFPQGGYETTIPYQVAESAAAVFAFQRAIEKAGSLDAQKVRDGIAALDFDSFYGKIKFDERGINTSKPMAVQQNATDGGNYTVGPAESASKPFEYPAPAWGSRK